MSFEAFTRLGDDSVHKLSIAPHRPLELRSKLSQVLSLLNTAIAERLVERSLHARHLHFLLQFFWRILRLEVSKEHGTVRLCNLDLVLNAVVLDLTDKLLHEVVQHVALSNDEDVDAGE